MSSRSRLPRPTSSTCSASARPSMSSATPSLRSSAPTSTAPVDIDSETSGTSPRRSSPKSPSNGTPAKVTANGEGDRRPSRMRAPRPTSTRSAWPSTTRCQPEADVGVLEVDPVRQDRDVDLLVRGRGLPGAQRFQLGRVDQRAAHRRDDDRLAADAGAMRVDGHVAAPELQHRLVEVPLVAFDARMAAQRERQVRLRRNAQPAREVARAPRVEPEREVGAACRLGARERALDPDFGVGRREIDLDRRRELAQHVGQLSAADRERRALAEQRAARRAAQALAAPDVDVEGIQREGDRARRRRNCRSSAARPPRRGQARGRAPRRRGSRRGRRAAGRSARACRRCRSRRSARARGRRAQNPVPPARARTSAWRPPCRGRDGR